MRVRLAIALALGVTSTARAQAAFAPPNPQQQSCIEAIAETPQEKKIREAIGEPPEEIASLEGAYAWYAKRAIAKFGSVVAAEAARKKAMRAKYTRQLELLRKNARDGHLPSLVLLASFPTWWEELKGITGQPTQEEISAAYRMLHDNHFSLAPELLAGDCWRDLMGLEAERKLPQEMCLDLLREGGFRGDESAWERLADYNTTTDANPVGIVPPVEHYAWLELEKLVWQNEPWAYGRSVPEDQQEELAKKFMNEDQRREALALAEKYVKIVWPRRIMTVGQADVCRLMPQFAGDPDPYGPDPSPR